MPNLTETERAILDLEAGWWKYPGAKETAIRERFGPVNGYYLRLLALIERPEAMEYAPLAVGRLRRARDRHSGRSVRRRGWGG